MARYENKNRARIERRGAEIAEICKNLLKEEKIPQSELAERFGISLTATNNFLNNNFLQIVRFIELVEMTGRKVILKKGVYEINLSETGKDPEK